MIETNLWSPLCSLLPVFWMQIGGLPTLFRYLGPPESVSPSLCSAALSVLACLTQNNPPVQQQVLSQHDPLPILTAIANRDDAQPRQVVSLSHTRQLTHERHHVASLLYWASVWCARL